MSIRSKGQTSIAFLPRQIGILAGNAKFPFAIHVLSHDADKSAAYGLRARAFAASGIALGDARDHFSDHADTLDSSVVMLAYHGERAVGTIRASFSHPWQPVSTLACAPYFPDLAKLKRDASGAIVEIGRMGIDPDISNTSYRTTLYAALVRAGYLAALAGAASHILVTAKEETVQFYEKMLGFARVGKPALYPPGDIPISLLVGTIATATRMQRAQNSFFRITPDEIAGMRASILSALIAKAA